MIKSTYQPEIDALKEYMEKFIMEYYDQGKEVPPTLMVLAEQKGGELGIVPCVIDPRWMKNGLSKKVLTEAVLPHTIQRIQEKELTPICTCLMFEMVMREASVGSIEEAKALMADKERVKQIPAQESLMMIYETEFSSETAVFILHHKGQKVYKGAIVRNIHVEKKPYAQETELQGLFQGIFRKKPSQN